MMPERVEEGSESVVPTSGWLLVSDGGPSVSSVSIHCSATDNAVIRCRAEADWERTFVKR